MRVWHRVSADFDDPSLVGVAGLVPAVALAERAGLHELVADRVSVPGSAGANAAVKVSALVAGMVAGADSIEDLNLLRHGAMGRLFGGLRAPTTLGTHLRAYRFGHVRQLDAVAARVLANLAQRVPRLLHGGDEVAYLDIDAPPAFGREVPPRSGRSTAMPSRALPTATPGSKGSTPSWPPCPRRSRPR